ncbi:MAG: hypothetical protein KGI00_05130 [Candidatus Micrarchaeota archaeon]|nr:hypothetical protein [Candidatus Micrarchaeota archaeon]
MYNTFQTIIIPGIIAFAATVVGTKFLIAYLFDAGVIAEDRNKERIVRIASSGGLAVAFGIILGMLAYTFGGTFIFKPVVDISKLLAVALSVILIALVGFLDDINVQSRRVQSTDIKDIRKGLKQWQKPLLTLIGAFPLIAINAGVSTIMVPFVGSVDLGLLYPLVILPLAVIFVSNAVNLLGGFDGLQPGMILVASFGLLIYSFAYGNYTGTFLSALLFAAVLAFLPFNMYRSRIIPGDSFTYAVGATIVAIAIMGDSIPFATIIFIPWIIEFVLHARRGFKVTDLGIRQRDGTFKAPYGKRVYSLTHLVMNWRRVNEKQVALYLTSLELVFVLMGFGLKFYGLA